ncbi:MAG TPA: hypothetical protein V6C58_13185 [Allocoleopsis sp.]
METRESHIKFIQQNLPLATAFVYQQYQTSGKGCIMVNSYRTKHDFTPVCYIGEKSQIFKVYLNGKWDDPDLRRMITEYNPQKEIIFAFIRTDGGFSCYRLIIPFSPIDIYQQFNGSTTLTNQGQLESGEFTWCF